MMLIIEEAMGVGGAESIQETFVAYTQFCWEVKSNLRNKTY